MQLAIRTHMQTQGAESEPAQGPADSQMVDLHPADGGPHREERGRFMRQQSIDLPLCPHPDSPCIPFPLAPKYLRLNQTSRKERKSGLVEPVFVPSDAR